MSHSAIYTAASGAGRVDDGRVRHRVFLVVLCVKCGISTVTASGRLLPDAKDCYGSKAVILDPLVQTLHSQSCKAAITSAPNAESMSSTSAVLRQIRTGSMRLVLNALTKNRRQKKARC